MSKDRKKEKAENRAIKKYINSTCKLIEHGISPVKILDDLYKEFKREAMLLENDDDNYWYNEYNDGDNGDHDY